jgi:hypothetical protein
MTTISITAKRVSLAIAAAPVTAVDIFRARAEARALLWQAGEFDLHQAVDVLQQAAVETKLVVAIGEDGVQAIMAASFREHAA